MNMQAVKIAGPGELKVVEIDSPEPDGNNVIIKVSLAGINTALKALKWHGRLVLAGIGLKFQRIRTLIYLMKEIEQKAAIGYFAGEFDLAAAYIADKKLDVEYMVTRTIGYKEVQSVFENLSSGKTSYYLLKGNGLDIRQIKGHHRPELLFFNQPERRGPEAKREQPVEGGRGASSLKMAQHKKTGVFCRSFCYFPSLSIVFGTPMTGMPFLKRSYAI